jgi:hypothetical protein
MMLALVASAVAASFAGAAGTETSTPELPLGFELPGSNAYSVEVYGEAAQGESAASVIVRVLNLRGSVTYHFPGEVEEGFIRADLGVYGQISVVFHPQPGGASVSALGCSRNLSSSGGYYEGTIAFHAKGLTAAHASRARGDDGLALNLLCASEVEEEKGGAGIYLQATGGPADLNLAVTRTFVTQIQAGISEDRGGIPIERSVSIAASDQSFVHDGLRTATISPTAPFSGSATFLRNDGAVTWRGNLRVDFPGRRNVPMTGNGVKASLRRARNS